MCIRDRPRPQGYPADPQDLWPARRWRALYQSPVTSHALPGGKLLLYLRRGDRRAQAVLAHHPGAAALRAAGPADPCRLYVRCLLYTSESNYLLLLASDNYDVPRRNRDAMRDEESDEVFSYILCAVCPVKTGKTELGYFSGDNEFHCAASQTVAAPELGFLFPAFDNRSANIYNALFYSRKEGELHQEFIDAIFHTDLPMSAAEQREAFESALSCLLYTSRCV